MTRPPIVLEVSPTDGGARLDKFLREQLPEVSRGSLRRLIEARQVLVDGHVARKGQALHAGQRVLVAARDERPIPQPQMPLDVLAVTPAIVVINKQPGHACHPLVPGEQDTIANALLARHPECATAGEKAREAGLVHRLDWGTSGVLLAARSKNAFTALRAAFSSSQATKTYRALVHGTLSQRQEVDLPIEAMPGDRRRVRVAARIDRGQPATSVVEPVDNFGQLTLVHVTCHTGRRHQVRVHLAALGHPLLGDSLYGGKQRTNIVGPFLHARSIEICGAYYEAPLPIERADFLRSLQA